MINPNDIYQKFISLLDSNNVNYKLFNHKPVFSYEDSLEVQKETGFVGTAGKCLVLKTDGRFIVYVTKQGYRVNFDKIKEVLEVSKIRLATAEELKENFGAEPGCAYPFGFDKSVEIFVDPNIFEEDWMLFSAVLPTVTAQIKGSDLRKVFHNLKNKSTEVTNFNQS